MTSLQHNEQNSVLEHLIELRKKLFIALFAFIFGCIIAHFFHKEIITFILKPIGNQHLIFLSPIEPLFFILKIDCITGFIISFPIIIWCLFSYIIPAFSEKARKFVVFFYVTSTLLALIGLWYAFFVMIPISLNFLSSITIPGIDNSFSVEKYLSFFITQALIIMGIFQVPIIVIGGVYLGFLKTKFLSNKRKHIYLILTIALAIITPTPDIFNLIIVLLPCIAIFEVSLIGGRIVEFINRKNKQIDIIQ